MSTEDTAGDAATPQSTAAGVSRKILKWVAFTLVFALLPVVFDVGVLLFKGQPISTRAVSSDASTYLFGFGIIASGLGDAVFEKIHSTGQSTGGFIFALVLSVFMITIGPPLYALAKAYPTKAGDLYWLAITYSLSAIAVSLSTVWSAAR